MNDKKKSKTLNWEQFTQLGNPNNVPEEVEDEKVEHINKIDPIYVHYEKKGRGGKEVSIIKGLIGSDNYIKNLCKLIKNKCGVGGSAKDGEILIQGNKREEIIKILKDQGYRSIKKVGG